MNDTAIGSIGSFSTAIIIFLLILLIYLLRYTSERPNLRDWNGRHNQHDEEHALTLDEVEALGKVETDDLQRREYFGAKVCIRMNLSTPPLTGIPLSRYSGIQQKRVAWEFDPDVEIANSFVEYRAFQQPFIRDESWNTILHLLAKEGGENVIRRLLEKHRAQTNSKHHIGQTALSIAAEYGHETVVKLLLEQGNIDADLKDSRGVTPLSYAAEGGHEAVVRLLLRQGNVDADSKDVGGWSPLSCAAFEGHEAVVRLLVDIEDVNPSSKDAGGYTPLSRAVLGGHQEIVKLLVSRNDVTADSMDIFGQTPLSYAIEREDELLSAPKTDAITKYRRRLNMDTRR